MKGRETLKCLQLRAGSQSLSITNQLLGKAESETLLTESCRAVTEIEELREGPSRVSGKPELRKVGQGRRERGRCRVARKQGFPKRALAALRGSELTGGGGLDVLRAGGGGRGAGSREARERSRLFLSCLELVQQSAEVHGFRGGGEASLP